MFKERELRLVTHCHNDGQSCPIVPVQHHCRVYLFPSLGFFCYCSRPLFSRPCPRSIDQPSLGKQSDKEVRNIIFFSWFVSLSTFYPLFNGGTITLNPINMNSKWWSSSWPKWITFPFPSETLTERKKVVRHDQNRKRDQTFVSVGDSPWVSSIEFQPCMDKQWTHAYLVHVSISNLSKVKEGIHGQR